MQLKIRRMKLTTKMATLKGRMGYLPPAILVELDDIMRENRLENKSQAFKELVKYARVGREAERIIRLDFGKSRPLPPVDLFYKPKRRGKWQQGIF